MEKGHFGWKATSEVTLAETTDGSRVLKLSTTKSRTAISAMASVCIRQDRGGYHTETHALFEDYAKTGIALTPCTRATEKAVRDVHVRALLQMDTLIAEATAHYAPQADAA